MDTFSWISCLATDFNSAGYKLLAHRWSWFRFEYFFSVLIQRSGYEAPYWVRIIRRSSSTVTGYRSSDGEHWEEVESVTVELGEEAYIGLAAAAHNNSEVMMTLFDNIGMRGL